MLNVKALLMKILVMLYDMGNTRMSEQLANGNVMSWTAGSAHGIKLPSGHYLVAFSYGLKTTQTRTDLASFRIQLPSGHSLQAISPYFFPCTVNGQFRYSYANYGDGWITAPGTWTANTEMRISGVTIMYDLGY